MITGPQLRAIGALALLAAARTGLAAPATVAPAAPASAPAASAPAPPVDAPNIAERLVTAVEARYAREGSLQASFTQTFRSAATGQQIVERGRIWVKRPGRMRWDYRQPEKKVFIVNRDGTTLSYVAADFTATRGTLPSDAPHLALLLGTSKLLDGFHATAVQLKQPVFPGSQQVKLTPKKPTDGIEVAYLEIQSATSSVERVLVVDSLGNESDLVLEKVADDARVQDDVFDLQLPPGVTMRGPAGGGR